MDISISSCLITAIFVLVDFIQIANDALITFEVDDMERDATPSPDNKITVHGDMLPAQEAEPESPSPTHSPKAGSSNENIFCRSVASVVASLKEKGGVKKKQRMDKTASSDDKPSTSSQLFHATKSEVIMTSPTSQPSPSDPVTELKVVSIAPQPPRSLDGKNVQKSRKYSVQRGGLGQNGPTPFSTGPKVKPPRQKISTFLRFFEIVPKN